MKVRIKNLRLRTIIGLYDWEREQKQDLVINVEFEFDGRTAGASDSLADAVDYKQLCKRIIAEVEASSFFLLEALAARLLALVLEDRRVLSATVEVDKPGALRFADSVSVTASGTQTP